MDVDFLTASFDPHKWDPYFNPLDHILAGHLGDTLHEGIDQRDHRRRGLLSESLASGPILKEDRIRRSVTSPGSPFVALDKCPQMLLHHLHHGRVHDIQHHPHLMDSTCDCLSLTSTP